MSALRGITKKRLDQIYARQSTPTFGVAYQPAILATREEAPSTSRPATIWYNKFRRNIHVLSYAEQCVLMLALYHPHLFELHEQKMLPPVASPHPLYCHPVAAGMVLPTMRGTVLIADELGVLDIHPIVRSTVDNEIIEEPGCWIGDFLLFLTDDFGPYLINWSVKSSREEFSRPVARLPPKRNMEKAERREAARHLVEKKLYEEVGISTHQIAASEIDQIVVANLRNFLLYGRRTHDFTGPEVDEILGRFSEGIHAGVSALEVVHLLTKSKNFTQYDLQIFLHQAIWERRLRIDLYTHFFIDQPMVPEQRDVLEHYSHLFAREFE